MLPAVLLVIYCLLIVLASLAGGWIPLVVRLTHTRMQLAMSFIGGAMLGVGILHLVPHAFYELDDIQWMAGCVLIGFLATFFLERVFHFHHHDAPAAEHDHSGHAHAAAEHAHDHAHGDHVHEDHAHATAAHGDHAHAAPPVGISWSAALAGLLLHSLLDGVALGASVMADSRGGGAILLGLGVFLAIFLHKPFDSLTLGTLMAMSGRSPASRHWVNFGYAMAVPVGVVLFWLGATSTDGGEQLFIGSALALSGGTFICIATSDLLPELQFHSHDRVRLSAALLLGVALASAIVLIEEQTHDHSAHAGEHAAEPDDADHEHAGHAHDH